MMNHRDMESLQSLKTGTEKDKRLGLNPNKWTRCPCCVWIIFVSCVLLCSMACSSLIIYTHFKWTAIEERLKLMKDEVSHIGHECRSRVLSMEDTGDDDSGIQDELAERHKSKRSLENNFPAFIHLHGVNVITELDIAYFGWGKEDINHGNHGFDLIKNGNSIYKIRIKNVGVYLVYAQVAVNGRMHLNLPNECSHQTVRHRKKGGSKVLLSSLVTQYHLGGPYDKNVHEHPLRALDTKVHMGVFMLHAGDELWVQVPKSCSNMVYSMTSDQSYFGIVQVSQNRQDIVPPPSTIKPTKRTSRRSKRPRKPTTPGKQQA